MDVLRLLMLLTPACLPQEAAQGPKPPIQNVRMDPERGRLTWELNARASKILCTKDPDQQQWAQDTYCSYQTLSLCNVTKYTVQVHSPPFSTWILFPERDEQPETAPADLSCWVHDVDFMSCRWAVGRAAPSDTQYRLYWKDRSRYRECGHYQTDSGGRHVGCRFPGISQYPRIFVVMVNGTSQLSSISCRDYLADLYEMEKLSPPSITAKCNKSSSFMEWKMFSHFNKYFQYQLQVHKSPGTSITENLANPGNYMVKMRVRSDGNVHSEWSPWGAPQRFRCDSDEERPARILRTSLLVAAGTLAVALLGLLLCKRFSLMRRLFPPIPRVREPVCDPVLGGELLVLEAGREDCPVVEVQALEET
ncbi:interleukin-3 receptor subunit alpha isoform X2 [Sciurus carolinensis]|uniref:interleukin-3 receptor subunit alpha isoform X2 n=1 Tax=Sciurus carolinensis TaxID=30640 RepID=UPI001FB433A7|nr:interleukin-3 receptor subunit alpha isoform X2 [Sciurus carolinensis]